MLPGMNDAPIGTRVMFSTPAAITTSYAPAITPCAAKCAACWDDPHWRSTEVPTTVSGKPGRERGVAADVHRLVPDLHDAAHDHVLDERRVDARALDERPDRVGREVDGVGVLELAVAPPERAADGVDDDCGGHGGLQAQNLTVRSSLRPGPRHYIPGPCGTWTGRWATAGWRCSAGSA